MIFRLSIGPPLLARHGLSEGKLCRPCPIPDVAEGSTVYRQQATAVSLDCDIYLQNGLADTVNIAALDVLIAALHRRVQAPFTFLVDRLGRRGNAASPTQSSEEAAQGGNPWSDVSCQPRLRPRSEAVT
ncbi:hypothetical protein MRX96_006897 [Rhipicephalus microplus]